jgi:hypothetical protein
MPHPSLDRFRADPDNWILGFIYFSRADSRLVVPKRIRGFGMTLNFARPWAAPFLCALLAVALAPLESVMGPPVAPSVLLGKVLVILAMLASANRFAARSK